MKCLLDTCTLLWMLTEPDKLGPRARHLLQNTHNEMFVSTVSFWELSLKSSIGKLAIEGIELEEVDSILVDDLFIGIIGLNEQESLSFCRLPFFGNHKDPFDRMLAWQAIKRNMTLLSGDPAFGQYQQCGLRIIW